MNIITLTLNPAFDKHCFVKDFKPFHENLATVTDSEAGGKGVNISRALKVNGVDNIAIAVLGEENAESFKSELKKDAINFYEISVPGRIRENITLHTDNADETRISFAGFEADDKLLKKVEDVLYKLVDTDTVVTFTGRLPKGVSVEEAKNFLKKLQNKGVKTVVDSRSFGKEDLLEIKPWLIKPNEEEIGMYTDIEVTDIESANTAAVALRKKGIENVMISLGSKGALLCCKDGSYVATPPKIEALSTIGAGDSSIAGFLAAAKQDFPCSKMLRCAVSYGTAACMSEGTRPPEKEDVENIYLKVKVKKIR